jgi:hypothetical protein
MVIMVARAFVRAVHRIERRERGCVRQFPVGWN